MEEEPAERVTTHHRSVGKEGLQRRGWRDEEEEEGGYRYRSPGLEMILRAGITFKSVTSSWTVLKFCDSERF